MSVALRFSPLVLVVSCLAGSARTQPATMSTSADVVVTAESRPVPIESVGQAVTVIDRKEIERRRQSSVLELLRSVPGVDIAQGGGPGKVASLFLRGTNSNQALVLVDGVKLNSPYFGGVDLSALSATNVERIEIVRGPYSALYGSEAVGGVVQIFTRRDRGEPSRVGAAGGFSATGRFAGGTAGTREGGLLASFAASGLVATAGFRRLTSNGDLANDFVGITNLSLGLGYWMNPETRLGVVARQDSSRTGVPLSDGFPTPRRSTTAESTSVAIPFQTMFSATTLEASLSFGTDRPTYSDPDDPFGFTSSSTRADRAAGRLVASRVAGAHRVSVGADYERTEVRNEDAYGLELDDLSTRTWAVFLEDRITLLSGRLAVTLGLRRDEHSAFGGSTNPRFAVSFQLTSEVRLRAAAGTAFRSPTTGELYYPFVGNALLRPERSTSFEVGAEARLLPGLTAEATAFHNQVRDLIVYDNRLFKNANVGRARMYGLETALRFEATEHVSARLTYTYLNAEDRDTGRELLRRPRHRAAFGLSWFPNRGESAGVELTALFVGRRMDLDAIDFSKRVENPSYLRFDVAATAPRVLSAVTPFLRVTNLADRKFEEVVGLPSPGRRFLFGVEVGF